MKRFFHSINALLLIFSLILTSFACGGEKIIEGTPELFLDKTYVEVEIGSSATVTANTKVENIDVNAEYSWEIPNEATGVVNLSPDGNKLEISGLKYGIFEITCKAVYNSKTAVKIFTVKSYNPSVVFTVNGLDGTNNIYNVSLSLQLDAENGYYNYFTPEISLTENGSNVDASLIEWSSSDNYVVAVFNGTVSAYDVGRAKVVAHYNGNAVIFDITVDLATYVLDETVYIEYAEGDVFKVNSKIKGDVYDVTFNGESIFNSFNRNTGVVSIATQNLEMGKLNGKIKIYAGNAIYSANAEYIAMLVSNAQEFIKIQDVGYELGDKADDYPTLEGIFYLDKDIKFTSADVYRTKYEANDWEGGFCGVLDGKGHIVDGLRILDGESLFANTAEGSSIQNISFINSIKEGGSGFIAFLRDSSMSNVYIHFKEVIASSKTYAISCENHLRSGNLVNVMTVIDKVTCMSGVSNAQFFAMGIIRHKYLKPDDPRYCMAINCVAVCPNFEGVAISGLAEYPTNATLTKVTDEYKSLDELKEVQEDWDSNFWTVINGIPKPNALI